MAGKCPEETEAQFIADCSRLDLYELCDKYDRAPSTIKEWRTGLHRDGKLLWWPGIRTGQCRSYDDAIELNEDAVIISDLEIPYHDSELLGYAVSIGRLFGITTLVIAGDLLANDALGYWPSEDTDESGRYTVEDSLQDGGRVLEALFQHFKRIVIIKGNHDQRGTRVKEWGFFEMMRRSWENLGDLDISFYKWCIIQGKRVEHFGAYAKVPGSVSRDRAEIEQMDVAGGHTHHLSMVFTKDGQHQAIELGHCTLPEKRYYKTVNGTTRHPKWVSGFWVLRNGYWYPFPKLFTDWSFWLRQVQVKESK